jgi:hypothetical protein
MPSFAVEIIKPLLVKSEIFPGRVFRKAEFPFVVLIAPLLVMTAFVAFGVFTVVFSFSIVIPELIVTLEPSPEISKGPQFVEIVSVEPDIVEQLSKEVPKEELSTKRTINLIISISF